MQLTKLRRHTPLLVGGTIVAVVAVVALLGPSLTSYSPLKTATRIRLTPPGTAHLLGTDHMGRDIFTRLLFGARLSMLVGATVVLLSSVAGIPIGLVGGYNRRYGNVLMRVVDGLLAFPGLLLALALMAVMGPRLSNIVFALAVIYTPRVARVMHGVVTELKEKEFVIAAQALGLGEVRILARHILLNGIGPILVQGSFNFASAIIAEASLSFLGVGVPPGTPSWGGMLSEGRNYMYNAPWLTIFPGLAIFMVVMGLNLLGDSLRDFVDPRQAFGIKA